MNILDCTLRDGGSATHNHWEEYAVKLLVSGLSAAGIKYIEIGNYTGLGGYRKSEATFTDDDYMRLCVPIKGDALLGMWFVPFIGIKDDLKRFRENGGDFVRIGANANDAKSIFDSIEYAKSLGLFVCCNLMKSYSISKYCLVKQAEGLVRSGADCIYIVDSAGGMLPNQVADYVRAVKEFYEIPIGFHGHNNLLMANANSLAALQAGAEFADATLRGLGRGAGNAQLESLVAICQKARLMPNSFNALELADVAEKVVGNLSHKCSSKREINVGMVNFHDSYTEVLEKTAAEYHVDPESLMEEVCKFNVIDPSEELFEFAAMRLKEGRKFEFVPAYSHKVL